MGESAPLKVDEVIPGPLDGERVDRAVAAFTGQTRAAIAALVDAGRVTIDDKPVKSRSARVAEGQRLVVEATEPDDVLPSADPSVEFDVVYSDDDIIVVDKPAGLVVHPGAGHHDGTLVNGLLARFPDLVTARPGDPARPGIVHRLDAGTTGLLVVGRTEAAYQTLVKAMKARDVERRYVALVWGDVQPDRGVVDAPIGRAQTDRTRMAVSNRGRLARTSYEVSARHPDPSLTLVSCRLETGRTHQIRVHLAAIGHPVVGDRRYGGMRQGLEMKRPFLHARRLSFAHPSTGETMAFESPLPKDLQGILRKLGFSSSDLT